ncbi:3-phosphoshikimate 1-carboxyvinyltransferase [Thermophilibacter immobilis]|jgi:3-phosphoshikimate 1-carboxyvinyltransferase|uniref:3-phosphoshikimate 1-carboxyvinyltransferase n=1 Tax=Thermophilibacter immobilis TaxID=2779519 RepID=A0A7S7M6Y6_9ACTN|nr:3-phosphoshikimate 1-carboxyvinyltransferase [Thermophilibacter immobilis]QOY59901.1 3-phosphoshikimate 1-carboxyvinyltransferase [Thermophilibacter immobilis]
MNLVIDPGALTGEVRAPSSKSEAHRLLICAALSADTTDVDCATTSADIDATVSCLEALGAHVARTRRGFRVVGLPRDASGRPRPAQGALLDCGESGSTLRFLLPVACALGAEARLTGRGRLPERPLSPLYEGLVAHGCELSAQGRMPLATGGRLGAGRFELPGDVSSQYVSGLLMAAPLTGGAVEVLVSEPVESRPYVGLTMDALSRFGVEVGEGPATTKGGSPARLFVVDAPCGFVSPGTVEVGGDWSNAAFWLAAGALGADGVAVTGADVQSAQGDRQILGALALLGARIVRSRASVACAPDHLAGRILDVKSCPDLVPPLAAVAAVATGTTHVVGAARLRLKESDRLATVSAAVNALGGCAEVTGDGLVIEGTDELAGGTVDAANDHRIAMMAAVLATRCSGPTTIVGAECVSKSYPAFFEDFATLGGAVRKES